MRQCGGEGAQRFVRMRERCWCEGSAAGPLALRKAGNPQVGFKSRIIHSVDFDRDHVFAPV